MDGFSEPRVAFTAVNLACFAPFYPVQSQKHSFILNKIPSNATWLRVLYLCS